jgi:acyl transferase domain-containing protein/NAD(P)H-dependent flavin oxidoreductase YrpB (nitropropane dioxygenase family)/NAD(P)-dependent dehydrogenase (short-subunit alcohol dehydrogenase family)/acyl carrier protein
MSSIIQETSGTKGALNDLGKLSLGIDAERFRLLAITPFERSDLPLARALLRHNAAVALDIGRNPQDWPRLWQSLERETSSALGLRVPDQVELQDRALPSSIAFVVCGGELDRLPESWRKLPVLAQVCSVEEVRRAMQAGAAGLIAKGQESGGRVGDESSFVLLQRIMALLAEEGRASDPVPVWCQGGIALNTAAAAFAGGAFGIVIDSILASLPECGLPDEIKSQILAMDGSEVRVASGYQVYSRGAQDAALFEGRDEPAIRNLLASGEAWPIGQDAALSRLVLGECASVEALVNTLRVRIAGQLQQARSLGVLDEGNAWARSHGTRYPIAQGPMTRVSDTAAFTVALAEAGGLPFLALSLMREEACRSLMTETANSIGDRPWGVGVLAFAAPEILDPQLELVKQFKPSALILAGGRPSQARPFIEMGIQTYLHVPSPGLLDLFLKDGATHFVFEGRECGGHVGPRFSFVLWEQAVSRLVQVENPEALHVLFAGGIHDERSSAMVAAIAAPLAARGAKIGILMGTAYIATVEAVRHGAVLEGFQSKALGGENTVLIETAPGHAVRCLPSEFVDEFAREKARLKSARVDSKDIWERLESFTVGRLRIATKGLDYKEGALVSVDAEIQQAKGMYMIGQVIALQRQVISLAQLHARVTQGAAAWLARQSIPAFQQATRAEPVAIVGMACIYPGAPDLESFWANILEDRDQVGEVPAERWSVNQYYAGANAAADKSVSKWGGFIDDTPFDPLRYGIPPAALAAIEPVQLLSLEVAAQALKDAGYASRWFDREKTSVIFGAEAGMDLGNQYTFRNLYPQYCGEMPEALAKALPSLTEDSFPGMLVNVISGRIANRLGLGGVNYAVTSACASSLTAIELGVKELRSGSSEMVLAGGADFHNGIADFLMFSSVGALSAKGRCRSFDNEADGIALGEGVGVAVLKRLADAERDGDRIYAVIDGIAGSSDGKGLGLTAPRREGQKRALERSYWQAGVMPSEIGLVEAHGTGTVVGDRTELKTLTEVYLAGGAVPGQAGLGSVKSQIGHTKCAAGIAGVIKVAKALHHGVLPPTGQITAPNAAYRAGSSPFQLNRKPAPWLPRAALARGAVSAFGFGGTNFHAVLSAYPRSRSEVGANQLPAELFAVRGASRAEVQTILHRFAEFLAASDARLLLRDLARSMWQAGKGPVQLAFVAHDVVSLRQIIVTVLAGRSVAGIFERDPAVESGKLAFLFSGQGSQYSGMLRDLLVYFPPSAALLAAGRAELPFIYPPTAYDEATRLRQQLALTDTRRAQPAIGLVELAAFDWLGKLGVKPDMSAGHSYGELVALATAGAFDAATLLKLSRDRAEAILCAIHGDDTGAMAAVRLDVESLRPLLEGFPTVVMANQNSPIQTVISGPTADVEAACAFLGQSNVGYKRIDTDCAFHSPLMATAESQFARVLEQQPIGDLQWPVYSNVSAAPHADDAAAIRESLARHIVSPVRFVDQIQRMHADGARVFVEVGPRKVLTGLVGRILKDQPHTAIALDAEERGFAGLLSTLARLAVLLPHFDASALFAGRAEVLDLNAPQKLAATTWLVNGGRARPLRGALPASAGDVVIAPVISAAASAPTATTTAASATLIATTTANEQALVGYLGNMRELVNAQRDVLLAFLGAPAMPATPMSAISTHGFVAEDRKLKSQAAAAMPSLTMTTHDPASSNIAAEPASSIEVSLSAGNITATTSAPDARQLLLSLVSERTGYPIEMLDLDLDLEADLSIDSIKRLEIIGELSQRLSLRSVIGVGADALLEQLTAQKTLRAVLNWLAEKLPAQTTQTTVSVTTTTVEMSTSTAHASATLAAAPALSTTQMLLEIVSQSTGYPPEVLDLNLDLEADLSIDSIKRLEVVGQLASRLGIESGAEKDAMLEQLSGMKTLQGMIERLEQRQAAAAAAPEAVSSSIADAQSKISSIPLERYVLRRQDAPPAIPSRLDLSGKQFLISDDGLGLAARFARLLELRGATATIVDFPSATAIPAGIEQIDGLIHLWSLNPASRLRDVKRLFAVVRDSLQKKARHVLVASALGGDFGASGDFRQGAGFAGLVKSVVKEFPEVRAHWVDCDLSESLDTIAQHIEQELLAENPLTEVAYKADQRYAREIVRTELTEGSLDGLPLTPESIVLITGGARGITALMAIELARRYRCHLEVVGRSAAPVGEESALTRDINDPRKLRQALLSADSSLKPGQIELTARRILADRAARETYAQVIAAGGSLFYTKLDVRDSKAFLQFIDQVYARHGRIDGVIHGAGVVEDKLVRDKTDESFGRVFDTKVGGALALRRRIRDNVKFVVFFSSVASAFGNRGQVDYASANDVLDKLAHSWQQRISGRVLSVNWGPWADTGMVSESLKNEYQRKGIGLIPQQEGVNALLRELSLKNGEPQVVLMCGKPENFDGRASDTQREVDA